MSIGTGIASILLLVLVTQATAQPEAGATTEYYPLAVGNEWVYRANNYLTPVYPITIKIVEKTSLEYTATDDTGKKLTRKVTAYLREDRRGDVVRNDSVAVLPDGVHRFELDGKEITPPFRFLMLPPRDGATWKAEGKTKDAELDGTFKVTREAIEVPAGKFQTIKVTSTSGTDEKTRLTVVTWYTPNVGMVKQQLRVGMEKTLTMELERFTLKK